jgi:polyadenylate-binding protein
LKAVQEMNNYVLEDKTLVVTRFEKKSARLNHLKKEFEEKKKESFRQDLNLYVKNLDEKIDSIRLEKEFEKFGTILSAKVMLDENNNSKGFGFVSFSKQEGAQKALAEMNGRILSTKPLFICIAQRKEDRKRTLANKFKETFQFNSIPLLPNQYYKHQNVTVPRWQNKQTNLISVQQQYYPKTNQFRSKTDF